MIVVDAVDSVVVVVLLLLVAVEVARRAGCAVDTRARAEAPFLPSALSPPLPPPPATPLLLRLAPLSCCCWSCCRAAFVACGGAGGAGCGVNANVDRGWRPPALLPPPPPPPPPPLLPPSLFARLPAPACLLGGASCEKSLAEIGVPTSRACAGLVTAAAE